MLECGTLLSRELNGLKYVVCTLPAAPARVARCSTGSRKAAAAFLTFAEPSGSRTS